MAPAADFKWSATAMSESFYMSNMSPQQPGFNRGIWKMLEGTVRNWAAEEGVIHIVTGPVLTGEYHTIGYSSVSVPAYYYKVILDYREPELKAIGFILPNRKSRSPLQSFAVNVDAVEEKTGIDFFSAIPDNLEATIESNVDVSRWSFQNSKSYSRSSTHKTKAEKLVGESLINVNTASKSELMKLPGIGSVLAGRIIEYRSVHGPLRSINELKKVKGIGLMTMEKLRPYAVVY